MNIRVFVFAVLSAGVAASLACTVPASNDRYVQTKVPDQASFPPVSALLTVRCGSLDCHGNIARNLRVYGSAGRRYSPNDQPFVPPCDTNDEVAQTYVSVIGLEPEVMNTVASGGDPGTLTMIRKARGTEAHKGEKIWSTGDDSDLCLTAWLTGAPNPAACNRALASVLPLGDKNPLLSCSTSSDQ